MATWIIEGADKKTGREIRKSLSAVTEGDAIKEASQLGILVSSIRKAKNPNELSKSAGFHAMPGKSSGKSKLLIGCLVGGGLFLLIVVAFFAYALISSRHSPHVLSTEIASPVTPQPTATVSVEYDKFNDRTEVSVGTRSTDDDNSADWSLLYSDFAGGFQDRKGGVMLRVSYTFSGHNVSSIEPGLFFDFEGIGVGNGDSSVVFLLDGQQRIKFVDVTGKPIDGKSSGYVKPEDAIAISRAKSAEVQIGSGEFKLKPKSQEGIAELLKQLGLQ